MARKGKGTGNQKKHAGRRVPTDIVAKMREEWIKDQNCSRIGRLFNYDDRTVGTLVIKDQWREYLSRIKEKAIDKLVEKRSDDIAKAAIIVEAYISRQAKALSDKEHLGFTITGLDKAVRLLSFLHGEPDTRNEQTMSVGRVVITIPDNKRDRKNNSADSGNTTKRS